MAKKFKTMKIMSRHGRGAEIFTSKFETCIKFSQFTEKKNNKGQFYLKK